MKKITAIALVLLTCAFILGVGGAILLAGGNAAIFNDRLVDIEEMAFCQPDGSGCDTLPGSSRGGLKMFCQPGDPGCDCPVPPCTPG